MIEWALTGGLDSEFIKICRQLNLPEFDGDPIDLYGFDTRYIQEIQRLMYNIDFSYQTVQNIAFNLRIR